MDSEALNEAPVRDEASVLINRYHFCEETLRSSCQRLMKPYTTVQTVVSLLMLGLALFYTVAYGEYFGVSKTLPILVILLCLLAGLEFWRARNAVDQAVKRTLQRTEAQYGVREYDVTLRFGEKQITVTNSLSDEAGSLAYEDFRSLKRYEDLIVLRIAPRSVCTMDPKRFENGTEADFWALMREKCPKAVPERDRT